MKNIILLVVFLISTTLISQTGNKGNTWIREDLIDCRIQEKKDSICHFMLLGFVNPFKNDFRISGRGADELFIPKRCYKIIDKKTIKLEYAYASMFLDTTQISKYDSKKDKKITGLLKIKGDKLEYTLYYNEKLFATYYLINKYKDYYFEGIRRSLDYIEKHR